MVYYLLILDAWFERYGFSKFQLKSDSNFYVESVLNRGRTRGEFSFADTGSEG
jgi:hypothetical protein